MTSRIADLCLGTDKDWKMGKTKIFLKVSCWEDWLLWLLGTVGGEGKSPSHAYSGPQPRCGFLWP